MTFVVHANLDCEATWAGVPLPRDVTARISLLGALTAALAPEGERVEVWTPSAFDMTRVRAIPGFTPPTIRTGTPPRADLVWAQASAKDVNDRRLAHALCPLPGARVITSLDELDHVTGRWVLKAPWTSAGRDRVHGTGAPNDEQRRRIPRMLARCGALVFEPWMDKILDVGVCATVDASGTVTSEPPHSLHTSQRGHFLAIDLAPPALEASELATLTETLSAVGAALHARGFTGAFAIDAYVYTLAGARRFHPLCEINARHTFGWVARALGRRAGITQLGMTGPRLDAHLLIAHADDGVTAWCA